MVIKKGLIVFALSLIIIVGVFATIGAYSLGLTGSGNYLSEYSSYGSEETVHLYADLITDYLPSNEGRIVITPDFTMTLNEIDSISWDAYVVDGYAPHVDVFLDNGKTLVFEYAKVDQNDCDDVADYPDGAINTFYDKGIVDDSAYAWLSSGPAGPCGNETFDANHNSLAEWKASDGEEEITKIEIEVDGWIYESESHIWNVEINNEDVLELTPIINVLTIINQNNEDETWSCTENPYVNQQELYISGSASDAETGGSEIDNVQYSRESEDNSNNANHDYTNSDPSDGSFNEVEEDWQTKPFEETFLEGNHTITAYAIDEFNNEGETASCEFCVDTQEPETPEVSVDNTFNCEQDYTNEEISFSWTEATSNGCAPVDYYEVEINDTGQINPIIEPELLSLNLAGTNEHTYSIRVRAVDMAGNTGDWSSWSEDVYYDNGNPTVEITAPQEDDWFNTNFDVSENDADAENSLLECQIEIQNNQNTPYISEWSSDLCNNNFNVILDTYCSDDGNCAITKRAKDKACNIGENGVSVNIDRTPPETTKTVGEPKVEGFEWLQWVIDWFITDETEIVLECSDGDEDVVVGCDATYYRIKYAEGNWSEWLVYEESFAFEQGDGVYEIEYYSTDELENTEEIKNETDKVDTQAPTTTKTIGTPQYNNGSALFITSETLFNLTCSDSEVGCDYTSYQINENEPQIYSEQFNIEEEDGLYTLYYDSIDLLGNEEEQNTEEDWLDNTLPTIIIHNPTQNEAGNIQRCSQAIVVEVFDNGAGINNESVRAELINSQQEVVRNISLRKSVYSGEQGNVYEALMDKSLPTGEYELVVYTSDNLGNQGTSSISEYLSETVFVEYISPAFCNIDPILAGECDFTFHTCIRGDSNIQFRMNKLGEIITPAMMNAEISNNNDSTFD